jgi:peptidoglycan-associated lipoprotein
MEPADPAAPGQVPGQTTVVPPPTPAGPGQPSADDATGQMQLAAADTLPAPPAEPETAGPAPEPGPAKAGFEPVHFETDSWRILPEDTASLRTAAARLIEMAGTFTLEGYCDPRGTEQHNDTLGLKRARAVQDWLATAGVPAERLVAVTRGETGLLSTRPEEYWKDRRVEFEVK